MLKALTLQVGRGMEFYPIEIDLEPFSILLFFVIVRFFHVKRALAPPTFGSSPNFEAILKEIKLLKMLIVL